MDRFQIGCSCAFAIVYAASMSANVTESRNVISIAMTGAGTLSLSGDAQPVIGDEIILKVTSDGTARDLTFSTGFTAPVLAGVISKTKVQTFVYDGASFIPTGSPVQIN
ncbi:hypothetical protein [Flavobacterium cerinum]|uniref:Uncharacterized protein n=1 Tax=Flavobacterium cerinum TaxID=2502784 RepID=A0A3S3SF99_9FLAO|nr:hypothetical protein [Flavobacterium cerinum]RWX00920.1 hypothetical protein EPI11_07820 [Flavobacterium cerinum]